jgi:hypothetical protein
MVIGILSLTNNSYDEFRGETREPSIRAPSDVVLKKESNPENFHNAMVYKWSYAIIIVMAGFTLFMFDKRQERLDPLSPDVFGDEMDDELKKDEEQRKNPEL